MRITWYFLVTLIQRRHKNFHKSTHLGQVVQPAHQFLHVFPTHFWVSKTEFTFCRVFFHFDAGTAQVRSILSNKMQGTFSLFWFSTRRFFFVKWSISASSTLVNSHRLFTPAPTLRSDYTWRRTSSARVCHFGLKPELSECHQWCDVRVTDFFLRRALRTI
jgi:hypothetical protein